MVTRIGRLDPGMLNVDVLERSLNGIRTSGIAAVCFAVMGLAGICHYIRETVRDDALRFDLPAHALVIGTVLFAIVAALVASIVAASFPLKNAIQLALFAADIKVKPGAGQGGTAAINENEQFSDATPIAEIEPRARRRKTVKE
jgi:amino acid transporter